MKVRNEQVAMAFLKKQWASGSNFYSQPNILFSYQTPIACWVGESIFIDETKYSHTTSKQISLLKRCANTADIRIYTVPRTAFARLW